MKRRYREPEVRYPEFIYEEHGLDRKTVPLFMTLILNDPYASIEDKQMFLNEFGYRYIEDKDFQKEVDGKVILLELHKYVTYTERRYIHDLGNPDNSKVTVKIGKQDYIGAYGSSTQINYCDHYFKMKSKKLSTTKNIV